MLNLKNIFVVLSMVGSLSVQAADCLPTSRQVGNCLYSIPTLKSGLAAVINSDAASLFAGSIAVACNDGELTIGKTFCKLQNVKNCEIPSATWIGEAKGSCEHAAQAEPLLDGKELTINSDTGSGAISYSCSAGKLTTKSAVCGVVGDRVGVISAGVAAEPVASAGVVGTNTIVTSQAAAGTKSYIFNLFANVKKSDTNDPVKIQVAARSKCSMIKGYDSVKGNAGIKTTLRNTGSSWNVYVVECPVTITASCDQDYVQEEYMSGDYNQKVGEYVDPPFGRMRKVCIANGYSDYLDIAYLGLTWDNIVDDYTGILFCGGSSAACAIKTPSVNPSMVSAISCTDANVKADAVAVTAGGSLTLSAVQTQVCGPLKFSTAKSITTSSKISSTNTVDYYAVTAVCGGYTATASAPLRTDCSGGSCLGGLLPAGSSLPYTEIDGKRYQNLCEQPGTPPANLCASCQSGSFTFRDPANGNSCTITAPTMVSGKVQNVGFADTSVNGNVDLSCNNGGRGVAGSGASKCYKSCASNANVPWTGNGGATCAQRTPSGTFVNGQTISLTATTGGTGTANLQCDGNNGNWVVKSATCAMGCSGSVSWGAGSACSGTIPSLKDGATGTISSSTGGSGSTNYRCNNGKIETYGSTCSVSCPQSTQVWGSVCTNSLPVTANGQSITVSHSASLATSTAGKTASGSATFSCNNGVRALVSGSCKYIIRQRVGPWSNWYNTSATTCSAYTPDASTVPVDTTFTQTRTCSTNQQRDQTTYTVWSDQTETVLSVKNEPRTVTNTESRSKAGSQATILPISNVIAGCVVKSSPSGVFAEKGCLGAQGGQDGHGLTTNISFVVGNYVDKAGNNSFDKPSEWSASWSGGCVGTGFTCRKTYDWNSFSSWSGGIFYDLFNNYFAMDFIDTTVTVTHVPTGKKFSHVIKIRACYNLATTNESLWGCQWDSAWEKVKDTGWRAW